jgi:hypothetical protein
MRVTGPTEHDGEMLQAVDQLAERILYPWTATDSLPGSVERIATFQARAAANLFRPGHERTLFIQGDRNEAIDRSVLCWTRQGARGTLQGGGLDWGGAWLRPCGEDSHAYRSPVS